MLANVLTTLFIGTMAHITTTSIITICLGVAFYFMLTTIQRFIQKFNCIMI